MGAGPTPFVSETPGMFRVAPPEPVTCTALTKARDVVLAATVVTHGPRWSVVSAPGPAVAGRGGDEDARVVGVEECELDRVGIRVRAAADREVDDVDAVLDGGLDGGDGVGAEAPLGAADLEHLDVGTRRDAGDDPAVDPEDRRRDTGVAGSRGRGVGAVAVVVTGAQELAGVSRAGPTASYVAMNRSAPMSLSLQVNGASPGVALPNSHSRTPVERRRRRRIWLAGRIGIRVGRMLGPDARVEDADDDALAGALLATELRPDGRRADERRRGVGLELQERVRVDRHDAWELGHCRDLVGRHDHRDAVEDEVVAAGHLRVLDVGVKSLDEGILLALQERPIPDGVGALQVESRVAALGGVRRAEPVHAAPVGGDRRVLQLDDDRDLAVFGGRLVDIRVDDPACLGGLDLARAQLGRIDPMCRVGRRRGLDAPRQ